MVRKYPVPASSEGRSIGVLVLMFSKRPKTYNQIRARFSWKRREQAFLLTCAPKKWVPVKQEWQGPLLIRHFPTSDPPFSFGHPLSYYQSEVNQIWQDAFGQEIFFACLLRYRYIQTKDLRPKWEYVDPVILSMTDEKRSKLQIQNCIEVLNLKSKFRNLMWYHKEICKINTVSRQVSSTLGVVLAGFAKFDNEIRGCAPSGLTTSVRVLCSQWAARHTSHCALCRRQSWYARMGSRLQSLLDLAHTAVWAIDYLYKRSGFRYGSMSFEESR